MVDPIKRILIKHPKDAYKNQSKIDQESPQLNYLDVPDFEKAKTDYDKFVEFLESYDIEIHFLPVKDTDFIISVIAEELGFVAIVFLLSGNELFSKYSKIFLNSSK